MTSDATNTMSSHTQGKRGMDMRRGKGHLGWVFACVVAAMLSRFSAVRADDLLPPSWRGDPGTTFQQWRFDSSECIEPEAAVNPYGNPSAVPQDISALLDELGVNFAVTLFRGWITNGQDRYKLRRINTNEVSSFTANYDACVD